MNLVDHLIEVHTHPIRDAYTRVTPYRRGESVAMQRFADVVITVSDVLP